MVDMVLMSTLGVLKMSERFWLYAMWSRGVVRFPVIVAGSLILVSSEGEMESRLDMWEALRHHEERYHCVITFTVRGKEDVVMIAALPGVLPSTSTLSELINAWPIVTICERIEDEYLPF